MLIIFFPTSNPISWSNYVYPLEFHCETVILNCITLYLQKRRHTYSLLQSTFSDSIFTKIPCYDILKINLKEAGKNYCSFTSITHEFHWFINRKQSKITGASILSSWHNCIHLKIIWILLLNNIMGKNIFKPGCSRIAEHWKYYDIWINIVFQHPVAFMYHSLIHFHL
jgi:hypothetical protein